jgi:hypothetical protein
VALIAVSTAIAIVGALGLEFSTNTTVDLMAAANARDAMVAHFLNESGANLGQLVIRVQTDVMDRYRQYLGDIQLADYTTLFMGAFGGGKEEVEGLSAMLGGFDGEAIKGLGVEFGTFDLEIDSEEGKINLNCANGSEQTRNTIKTQLDALMFFDAYDPIFQNADSEGWRRDRSEQSSALIDYIDRDRSKFGQAGAPEDYGYETLRDAYKPKNNYIDSVGELNLIRGVDDRFWTLFGDRFTVYGDCTVNIGAVDDPQIFAAIIMLSARNPEDPVVLDANKLWALAKKVGEAREMGVFFDDLNAFADFVKSPDTALGDLFASQLGATGATPPPTTGVPVEGVELDQQKLGQIAKAGVRRLYRVNVTSTVGRMTRTLTAVWDTNVQNQNARGDGYSRGNWVFWKEE